MAYYIAKIAITTVLIVLISEVSRRSSLVGAVLASIPLVSVMAMVWLYIDTGDVARVESLSHNVFWLVIPSLVLFVTLPVLLKNGINFYLSLGLSIAITSVCYSLMLMVLSRLGINP